MLVNKLKRADQQDRNAIQYILRYTYGVSGPVRHVLLKPILEPSKEGVQPEPLIAHRPRTAPPPKLSQLAEALIVQFSGKKLEPKLPIPEFKPLHPTRQANLLWRHRSKILRTIRPPLPSRILDELERKAGKATLYRRLTCPSRWTEALNLGYNDLTGQNFSDRQIRVDILKAPPIFLEEYNPAQWISTSTLHDMAGPKVLLTAVRHELAMTVTPYDGILAELKLYVAKG
ncbi:hypothetical protein BZG36_03752 [Bifiguratus adelaidae]|uniref:LYR motif-containing protein Cup1-like N-terminal domain-containing protein n=1 Tax=Bifiguratus adelaidae TaxID=1938954 RepID=A0A261XY41_9FUNG|nr:hypothetical protein BZG36_03752 [Bifiguratus adelaidae]